MENMKSLFEDLIRDIYDSERQLVKAMPKMSKAAQNSSLKEAIDKHLEQTKEHVRRIEEIAKGEGFDPKGVTCQGTVGLVKECEEHIEEFGGTPAGDAAILACAQKAEHYEIANYGTAASWAKLMGKTDALNLLVQTLNEEEATDKLLTDLAKSEVNREACEGMAGKASLK